MAQSISPKIALLSSLQQNIKITAVDVDLCIQNFTQNWAVLLSAISGSHILWPPPVQPVEQSRQYLGISVARVRPHRGCNLQSVAATTTMSISGPGHVHTTERRRWGHIYDNFNFWLSSHTAAARVTVGCVLVFRAETDCRFLGKHNSAQNRLRWGVNTWKVAGHDVLSLVWCSASAARVALIGAGWLILWLRVWAKFDRYDSQSS